MEVRDNSLKRKEIDYLKAFAIILVIFFHTVIDTGLYTSGRFWYQLVTVLDKVHVPLFILIAGYLCHRQPVGAFYLKKVRRILVPFLVMSALKLILTAVFHMEEHAHGTDLGEQLYDAFVRGQLYWFCYCLLLMFLIAPLLWDRAALIWILLAVLLVVNSWLKWNQILLPYELQINQVVGYLPYFLTGMLLARYRFADVMKRGPAQAAGLVLSVAAGCVSGYLRLARDLYYVYLLDVIMGMSVMFVLYLAALRVRGRTAGRILGMIGRYSLQIMLLDSFYRTALLFVLRRFMPEGIGMVLPVCICDLCLSCLTCLAVERIPVISALFGLSYKQKADRAANQIGGKHEL